MSSTPPSTTTTASPTSSPSQTSTSSSSTTSPTSSTSSSSSSSSSSTSASASNSGSSSSSSTTPATSSTTAPNTEPVTSASEIVSTSGTVVITRTSTSVVSATRSISSASASAAASKGFFQNTGAVAGTFTAVGLVALALLFLVITTIVRRRRARAFDRELQEATREAAAVSAPAFLDDDDDGYGPQKASNGYSGYGNERQFSDLSHGTYNQSPLSHSEAYNMRELGPGPGVGEIYDPYGNGVSAAVGGAAGIGVARARSMKTENQNANSYAAALSDGASPYAAFAGPQGGYGTNAPPMPSIGAGMGGGDPYAATAAQKNLQLLEAAGMGTHIAGAGAASAALSRSQSQQYQDYQQQPQGYGQPQQRRASQSPNENDPNRAAHQRMTSTGSSGHGHEQPLNSASTGATQYYSPGATSPQYNNSMQAQAQHVYNGQASNQPQQRWSVVNEDAEDAYGGYSAPSGPPQHTLPNPFANASSADGHAREWDRDSRSEYSQEEPRRVLKVANE